MSRRIKIEKRIGERYLASLSVRVEWDTDEGTHVIEEGKTENVGPEGTLVHLNRLLPSVGSQVRLVVLEENGNEVQVLTEVLRIERNAAHPQAALMLLDSSEEWRGRVWEPALPRISVVLDEILDDEEEDSGLAV